jgi:hypothetical protein
MSILLQFQRLCDWQSLNREQVYATRTVQQLKSNLKALERTRAQVADEDVAKFDEQVKNVQDSAIATVEEFLRNHGQVGPSPLVTASVLQNHSPGGDHLLFYSIVCLACWENFDGATI